LFQLNDRDIEGEICLQYIVVSDCIYCLSFFVWTATSHGDDHVMAKKKNEVEGLAGVKASTPYRYI
jgi:hypothetical protein